MVIFLLKKFNKFSDQKKFDFLRLCVDLKSNELLMLLHNNGISLSTINPKFKSSILHYVVTKDNSENQLKVILKNTKHIEHRNSKKITAMEYVIKNKKKTYEKIIRPYYLNVKINKIRNNYSFYKLKSLYIQYPEILTQLHNKKYIISLNGPQDLMIGDLKVLFDKKRPVKIIISQVNRFKRSIFFF